MVKILNCYLYAKKVMALCLRVQFFLAIPAYHNVHHVIIMHFFTVDFVFLFLKLKQTLFLASK